MPSFAYLPINKVRAFLPLNGKTSKLVGRLSLPQGFKNSPTIFGNHLAKELENWEKENPEGLFLQDVDDILLVTEANEKCVELTISLLNFQGQGGYKVSWEKAQIMKQQVIYLGIFIFQDSENSEQTEKRPSSRYLNLQLPEI